MASKYNLVWIFAILIVAALTSCTGRTILNDFPGISREKTIQVWFVQSQAGELHLQAVNRNCYGDQLKEAIEHLLRGPNRLEAKSGLGSEIPKGTILLGIQRRGKDVELNLSRRFTLAAGVSSFETRLEQLRRTVKPLVAGKNVFLNVEGARLTTAGGDGLEVQQPINNW